MSLAPGLLATESALRTLSEALLKAASIELGIEATELQAEYRPAVGPEGRTGLVAEIYIYDTLSGGAGFSSRVGTKTVGLSLFKRALEILEGCDCDYSCYQCLRSFKNKFEHELLDRYLGAGLIKYLLDDTLPDIGEERLSRSTDLLFEDLEVRKIGGTTRNKKVDLPVKGVVQPVVSPIHIERDKTPVPIIITVTNPLTPEEPRDEHLRYLKENSLAVSVVPIDELEITRNLPNTVDRLINQL